MYILNNSEKIELLCGSLASKMETLSISSDVVIRQLIFGKENLPESFDELYQLTNTLDNWDIAKSGDLLGFIYQKIETKITKNKRGQYFTDPVVVNHIITEAFKQLPDGFALDSVKIVDPACGSGQFLIEMYKRLSSLFGDAGVESANKKIISLLHGFDIDATAVLITKYNLSRLSGEAIDKLTNIKCNDFIYKDALEFSQKHLSDEQFDIVIGNPPWGSSLSSDEKKLYRKTYRSARSGINTFTLFIERSLELLKEGGFLSLLVPEAFLNIKAHKECRNLLLSYSRINEITLWGDRFENVYAPSISFSSIKDMSPLKSNSITIKNLSQNREFKNIIVNQKNLLQTHENIISIHFTQQTLDLLTHITSQDCFYLKGRAKFFLGVVTGNNQQNIKKGYSNDYPDPIIIGKDITKYKVNYSNNHFNFDPDSLQQTAPKDLYLTPNKIIYKFIGKRLTFALEEEGRFMLNNVNGFIPDMETVTPEAMLAILNSSLIQYFYEKNFFAVRVLRGNLEKLPLRTIGKEAEAMLTKLARDSIESDSLTRLKEYQNSIDDIVFHEYDIKDKEAYYIWEEYNSERLQTTLPNM